MKKLIALLSFTGFLFVSLGQKETKLYAEINRVTVFKTGAQIEHKKSSSLTAGRQLVVFEKLTDFLDPSSIQLKCSENATIISIRTRKNYDDKSIAQADVETKNEAKKVLEKEERKLRDEYKVLLLDEQLLQKNNNLSSQQQGVKVAELKEASTFFHAKMSEILTRKSELEDLIEKNVRKQNIIEQEISTRKSLPVINYTEIEVELELNASGSVQFEFNYITANASWTPYYDMRSAGIGAPMVLEAKGLVTQNTGIDWKDIHLVLSTNDPYDNTKEPELYAWNLDNYSPMPVKTTPSHYVPPHNYTGEVIHGEVSDIVSGEPLAFAKLTFPNAPNMVITTDAAGKFSFLVPGGESGFYVSYLGYQQGYQTINGPYLKVQMLPETIAMEELNNPFGGNNGQGYGSGDGAGIAQGFYSRNAPVSADEISVVSKKTYGARKQEKTKELYSMNANTTADSYNQSLATIAEKDLRMEFNIDKPFSVPSDNAEHRVSIANYTLPASYEYHAVPKLDKEVYLIARISGWEKMNLLSGESNLYFDGTYIGKSYIDVNSTKDTLNFSLGKDKKIQIERKKVDELSKTKANGSKMKYEVTWEFTVRNNGQVNAPLIIKDQFPISINSEIKVKNGSYEGATLDPDTGILTWKLNLGRGESKKFRFDFSIDYNKNNVLYLE